MDKTEIKKIVCEQIMNMWENNVLREYGGESIVGWLEDGDVFADDRSDEEIDEIMAFVREIADLVDDLSWKLDPKNED